MFVDGGVRAVTDRVVLEDRLSRTALLLELGNICARYERLAAGAREHRDADRVVPLELVEDFRHRFPHVERDGVVARRIVEQHPADRPVLAGDHPFSTGLHPMSPSLSMIFSENRCPLFGIML